MSIERALERLYEEPRFRDELDDEPARVLLGWAEQQVMKLHERAADADQFDAQFKQFRSLLVKLNRFVGQRDAMDAAARQAELTAIAADARALGATIDPAQVTSLSDRLAALDTTNAVTQLTALCTPRQQPPRS